MKKIILSLIMIIALSIAVKAYAAEVIKVDGSSTVYPITEAVAEEFPEGREGQDKGDCRHLRDWRRL